MTDGPEPCAACGSTVSADDLTRWLIWTERGWMCADCATKEGL